MSFSMTCRDLDRVKLAFSVDRCGNWTAFRACPANRPRSSEPCRSFEKRCLTETSRRPAGRNSGSTVDSSAVHSLLKDLDDLALIRSKELSREQIVARQLKKRRGILEHLQCDHLSSLLQWMKNSLEFYRHSTCGSSVANLQSRGNARPADHDPGGCPPRACTSCCPRISADTATSTGVRRRGRPARRMQTVNVGDYFEEVTQRVLHLNPCL